MFPQLTSLLMYTAAAFSLVFILYLLFRKQIRSTIAFWLMLVFSLPWALGSVFQTLIPALAGSRAPAVISQSGAVWMQFAWLVFVRQFAWQDLTEVVGRWREKPLWRSRRYSGWLLVLAALPILATILIWLDGGRQEFWVSFAYPSILTLLSAALLVWVMVRTREQRQAQAAVLLICSVIPWAGSVMDMFLLTGPQWAKFTLLGYNAAAAIFLLGILRYRLLNVRPVAYQTMIAGLRDGILVLSLDNRVTHLNPAAEAILGFPMREAAGQPVERALARYPDLLKYCCGGDAETVLEEVMLQNGDTTSYFELHLSPLMDRYGYAVGRLVSLRNITKRVQAENASRQNRLLLKQSEEKYRSLVENINEVIFTTDTQGTFTYISPVVERYTGFSPESIIGQPFRYFVYPDDLPTTEVSLRLALSGQIQVMEFRILDLNGNIRHVRSHSRPILQDYQVVGLQGVLADVTERQRVEEALERRATQLSLLNYVGEQIAAVIELKNVLDSAARLIQKSFGYYHVGVFTPDFERNGLFMRAASGAFSVLFPENHHLNFGQGMVGWAAVNKSTLLANDVRLEPRYTNLYPDKIMTRSELAVPILVGEKMVGVLDIQSPLVNAFDDNDVRVMETLADQIAIAMENARLYEEVRRQLKDREQKENMMRIQRDMLVRLSTARNLDETLHLAVESLYRELRASRVAISLVDWEQQSIQPVVSLGYPLNRPNLPTPLDRNLAGRAARSGQMALVSNVAEEIAGGASGLEFPPGILTQLCVPLVSNGRVFGIVSMESSLANAFSHDDLRLVNLLANSLGMLVDRARLFDEVEQARTELEKRATALEEANASLRELDRLKSQFVANMSHELRTPLNSIIGFSEVLVDELPGPLNDEQKEFLLDILESGKHLLKLINDLLDFSKIEAGRMALEPSTFEIRAFFEELRITIAPLVEKKSQVLVFRLDGEIPPINADHLRIKQVFLNLLSNANKFTAARGIITASCRLAAPDQLLFTISDTGIGISQEDQDIIFEEFRQVDGSMTREVPGTGLGLAISRRIVEMHHGKIWVESELGSGSAFFVILPVNCAAAEHAGTNPVN